MQDAKNRGRSSKTRSGDAKSRRVTQRRQLLAAAGVASLLLAGILTLEVLPAGPVALGGRPPAAGDIADRSYKAPSDITVIDRKATEEHRRKALEQAPVVYDFDERWGQDVRKRLLEAFEAARGALQAVPDEQPGEGPDPAHVFLDALGEEAEVPLASVAYLAQQKFVTPQQGSLLRILEPALSRMIVNDSEELARKAEKRIIVVREVGSGEEHVLSPDAEVLDAEAARVLVRSEAARIFANSTAEEHEALSELAQTLLGPNLSFNLRATDERRQAAEAGVQDVTISLKKGEIIVRDGEPISERQVLVLEGIQQQAQTRNQVETFLGVAVLLFVALSVIWRFAGSSLRSFPRTPKDAFFLLLTLVSAALGTRIMLFVIDAVVANPEFTALFGDEPLRLHYVIPLAAATMLVRMVHNAETAALFAVLSALVAGLQLGGEVSFAFFVLIGSLVAAVGSRRVTQRGVLLRAGAQVGLANAAVVLALTLLGGDLLSVGTLIELAAAFVGGSVCGGIVMVLAPVVESVFRYTTDVRLLELANREQPLLRELEVRAPGTYHHSMMVGNMAEKAAEAIGANPLLAKVAGYYHDVGKMRRPHFFAENVTIHHGENRHDKITPSMSARIIQAHIKDGLEMGRQNKLAPPILRGIGEHHGTSLIRFFYEKAKEQQDSEKGEVVAEHEYRYPGPRPQTREAGILMLADSVEAASRAMVDISSARVQQLVQRITNNYFRDGQLDECSLTLRDLHAIARSFIETLSAIRHERIDYPAGDGAEGRKSEEGTDEGVVERLESRKKDRPEDVEEEGSSDLKRLGLP
jgi:putative nucleotidyltransferase with HDIG domain